MKVLRLISALVPIPFLFHFYEYNSHLARQEPILLFPGFVLFIVMFGVLHRKVKMVWVLLLGLVMTLISMLLGLFFIPDDGGWFKPFGRDTVILGTAVVYILGQLLVRWVLVSGSSKK